VARHFGHGFEARARGRVGRELVRIDGAYDAHDALALEAHALDELALDRARDRDDARIAPVLAAREESRLPGLDAPRDDGRQTLERGRDAAEDLRTAPRMHVDDVGFYRTQRTPQARQHRGIEIAGHRQRDDLDVTRGWRRNVPARGTDSWAPAGASAVERGRERPARGTENDVLDAARREAAREVRDLRRAAVEMPTGFDVRDAHKGSSLTAGAARGARLRAPCTAAGGGYADTRCGALSTRRVYNRARGSFESKHHHRDVAPDEQHAYARHAAVPGHQGP